MKVPLAAFSTWERGTIYTAIGAGFLQYEPYALGAVGKLSPRNALLGFVLIFCLLIPDLLRLAKSAVRALKGPFNHPIARPHQVWLLLLAIFTGLMLLHALTLGAFGADDDGYHLSAPKRWLTDGFLSYLPSYTNTNASLGFEMLYVLGLSTGNLGLKVIHFSAGIFSLLTLWLCGRRLGSGNAGAIAISLLLIATPICNLPFLFGAAFVDFGACWMTLTSVLVWLVWREQPSQTAGRLLVLMALLAGFAASFKSTALAVAVAWTPVLVWEARRRGLGWNRICAAALGLGFIAFLPVSPWLFRSWHLTGNPVFPMLSSLIPTRDWDSEMAAIFNRYVHYYSWAVATDLSESTRKAIIGLTAGLMLLSGGMIIVRAKDPAIRGLIGFSVVVLLLTLATLGMYFRYWLSAEMCVALALSVMFVRRFRATAVLWLPSALLFAALSLQIYKPSESFMRDLRVATGKTTLDQEYASYPPWNMWRYINEHTPADAHVLVGSFYTTFGASNYGCFWLNARCFTTDSYIQDFIRLRDWQSFARSLNQAGIHYLLISRKQFAPGRIGFSFAAERNEYPFCLRLADQYGQKLAEFGVLEFYRIDSIPETL